jgi:hypothetical protein
LALFILDGGGAVDGDGLTEGTDAVLVAAVSCGFFSPMAHNAIYEASDVRIRLNDPPRDLRLTTHRVDGD